MSNYWLKQYEDQIKKQHRPMGMMNLNGLVVKRKFRWMAEIQDSYGNTLLENSLVKISNRPDWYPPHIIHDPDVPDKYRESEFNLNFINLPVNDIQLLADYCYPKSKQDVTTSSPKKYVEPMTPTDIKAVLRLYHWDASVLEEWVVNHAFIQSFDFGISYQCSDHEDISITIRHSSRNVTNTMADKMYEEMKESFPPSFTKAVKNG
jgi:hypothetical protein